MHFCRGHLLAFSCAALAVVGIAVLRYLRRRQRFQRIPTGSSALITGASGGIGKEIALLLSKRGCEVFLVARTASALDEVAKLCVANGAKGAHAIPADITSADAVDAMVERVETIFAAQQQQQRSSSGTRPLRFLVLNAGRGAITPFDSSAASYRIVQEMMDVNFFANVRLIQKFMPLLESGSGRGRSVGHVLVVSSLAGVLPSALRAAYTASKHALQGFCNVLRQEMSERRIGVTLACPNFVQTEFHSRVASASGEAPKRRGAHRYMTPQRCAELCVEGVESDDYEIIMTASAWLGYRIRPFFPEFIDAIAKKKALGGVVVPAADSSGTGGGTQDDANVKKSHQNEGKKDQ